MGMYLYLRGATDADLAALRRNADEAAAFITDGHESFEVGKAWGALGSILFGDETGFLTMAEGPLDPVQDYGYGPALKVPPAAVADLAKRLASIDEDGVRAGLQRAGEATAYPYFNGIGAAQLREELPEYVELLQELREVVAPLVEDGHGMLMLMS